MKSTFNHFTDLLAMSNAIGWSVHFYHADMAGVSVAFLLLWLLVLAANTVLYSCDKP